MQRPPLFPDVTEAEREWQLQFDPIERGRRLTEFKRATEGKILAEVRPGDWRYVEPDLAATVGRRRSDRRTTYSMFAGA